MKNLLRIGGVVMAFSLAYAMWACGSSSGDSSGGGWNSGSESNPTASGVDAAGNAVTSIAPNAPIIAKAQGLLQNGVYKVAIVDPNGTALFGESLILVSDGSGSIADTVLAYLGNDAGNQGAMSIDVEDDGYHAVRVSYKDIVPGTYTAYFCKNSVESCGASSASATTTLQVSGTQRYVFATDTATGTAGVRSFLNGAGNVFAVVKNAPANTAIGLRVISNSFQVLSNGSAIPGAVAGSNGVVACMTDAAGSCAATALWPTVTATLSNEGAAFDIVADVGNDGTWNAGTDFMDADGYIPGFVIQDAAPPTAAPSVSKITFNGTDNISDIACAKDGSAYCTYTNFFSGIDVYGWLNPRVRSTTPHSLAHKFIILHNDNLANGDTLTPIQSFGYNYTVDPLQWGCTNEGRILLWPVATHVAGCYDVVMDINRNGVYDSGVDIIDGYSGVCGFVIPGVDGAPTVTINSITDGAGGAVADGGTTSSSVASFNITVSLGAGSAISSCRIRWAAGSSSSETTLNVSGINAGGTMDTQQINLFNGTNTVLITCLDNENRAGKANVAITSSNTATQNIHFQASLNWQKPPSGSFDMDLHLIEPAGTMDSSTDCYYSNCQEASGGNATVGAILNVDCTSQCTGPENSWIKNSTALKVGDYKVCVHPYSGEGVDLRVSIYSSGGSLIETVQRSVLNASVGDWLVGRFTCTAGTSGACTWSRADSAAAGACNVP